MKKFIVSLLFIFIIMFSFADGDKKLKENTNLNDISFVVIDYKSGELLTGVQLNINDKVEYTDLNGRTNFQLKDGEYNIELLYISYKKDTVKIIVSDDKQLEIRLKQE
jgi:hypothetical protein